MGKALFGTHAAPSTLRLLDEVRILRQRVAELEAALAQAEAAHAGASHDGAADADASHPETTTTAAAHAAPQPAGR